ncbi:TetR/AcrR family transcriptional regulator [Mycolicibacterium rufum]|uniref:TetR/AcrR family transcriptional regulator n=1 Tax=Mycolicibacterium rufum TaxID=318424 RepID=A0A9X3BFT3_9MYCO|nr:TetR/AcrR family transcriptional regulator [Mycolicibacterium rufum]KGI66867.1 TetR family transcriptional regulator [Mycolicibacterium rufum]MCV7071033.1 TetR/AcrR family transcriptional regulator [Mycolicibacterium rufum]ULP37696.1 TetR/AcrR family transcriptional regulator [Mycolicibacterium rufum]
MVERLASGRHQLSREEVAAHQRQRLFKALAAVMTTNGYSNTTVDDVIKEAKVSRATFYQHFESKQDLFMAGYARMQRHVIDAIRTVPTTGTPMQNFAVMLDRYLGFIALDPSTARLYLLEVYAAGPEAMRRRVELQQEFVAGVAQIFGARNDADRFACQALVAAISTLVINTLTGGDADAVVALRTPILEYTERVMGSAPSPHA